MFCDIVIPMVGYHPVRIEQARLLLCFFSTVIASLLLCGWTKGKIGERNDDVWITAVRIYIAD